MFRPPMPIIVGAPRSGTTLLRLMLDAHPELAIPPESGFLIDAAHLREHGGATPDDLHRLLTGSFNWPDFHVEHSQLRAELGTLEPFDVSEGIRTLYRLYARRFDKARVGDKTPSYCRHLPTIADLLPEARFIHLIRDGRAVAASVRGLWFAAGNTMEALAADWVACVSAARADAPHCPHYLEVRYEDLVTAPRATLREICDFVDLPYSTDMESHHHRAAARLDEHEGRFIPHLNLHLTKEQRQQQQVSARSPTDPSRVHLWKTVLTGDEVARFDSVAGHLLRSLHYLR
jgi:hypothetical protein